ncbi:TSL-kinase interacting protein 1-like isoform X2 [Gossypium australe]|uniref:TSL-kinase interacting protein 1-like isoform X2 n=1 Tax=Gossypium australe TaxID=47621 RepID=A0A5B6V748_9ROSI|nr:TSL-kinase interacting protein 1-like isoform X2 [Gossypium australe]
MEEGLRRPCSQTWGGLWEVLLPHIGKAYGRYPMSVALSLTLLNWNEVESNKCPTQAYERRLTRVLLPHMRETFKRYFVAIGPSCYIVVDKLYAFSCDAINMRTESQVSIASEAQNNQENIPIQVGDPNVVLSTSNNSVLEQPGMSMHL